MGINIRVLLVLLLFAFGIIFYIGASTSPIIVFVFSICIVSFCFSVYLTKWVLSKDEGPQEMAQVHLKTCMIGFLELSCLVFLCIMVEGLILITFIFFLPLYFVHYSLFINLTSSSFSFNN